MKHRNANSNNKKNKKRGGAACDGWCLPAVIYLLLGVVGVIVQANMDGYNLASLTTGHTLYVAFWTAVLYLLCANCYVGWAWVVLLFPLILTTLGFLLVQSGLVLNLVSNLTTGQAVVQPEYSNVDRLNYRFPERRLNTEQDVVRRYNIYY